VEGPINETVPVVLLLEAVLKFVAVDVTTVVRVKVVVTLVEITLVEIMMLEVIVCPLVKKLVLVKNSVFVLGMTEVIVVTVGEGTNVLSVNVDVTVGNVGATIVVVSEVDDPLARYCPRISPKG
jgi:hypothetical protein